MKKVIILLIALAACGCMAAQEGSNIALGKPYTMCPAPDYALCKDAGDLTQLTDGEYTSGTRYLWTHPSTVGWNSARPAIITIDLKNIYPIRGVSYSTAAGAADVQWPSAIYVLVSDDGKDYYEAGEMAYTSMQSDAAPDIPPYQPHKFWTDKMKTHGRYVALLITGPSYLFVDEVEVYKGEPAWTSIPFSGTAYKNLKSYFAGAEIRSFLKNSLNIISLRDAMNRYEIPGEKKKEIERQLKLVEDEISTMSVDVKGERIILPLNSTQERFLRAQALLWKGMDRNEITAWKASPWDPMPLVQFPPKKSDSPIQVKMMTNEFRNACFNIASTLENTVNLKLKIQGLPGGENPKYIKVHQAEWTVIQKGNPVVSALPLAEYDPSAESFLIKVTPGLVRQVWLTFNPKNVKAGDYHGSIILQDEKKTVNIPLSLKIYPIRFPDKCTLHLGGWDYTGTGGGDITNDNRNLVVKYLQEHFVDSPWSSSEVLDPGEYDVTGKMTNPPNTKLFDEWIDMWKNSSQYCVYMAVKSDFAGSKYNTDLFQKKVRVWAKFWARHMQDLGLKPEQLALLILDEPAEWRNDIKQIEETIINWASAVHSSGTGIRIWEDICYVNPSSANQTLFASCDVLCPNRVTFLKSNEIFKNYYTEKTRLGKPHLEFYSCKGPSRALDPYAYYRLQAWTCWQYGAKAGYFWAFSDSGGGSSWNEFTTKRAVFVPFFLDKDSVTPAKQMEAIREGLEDYEYLTMLKAAIDNGNNRGTRAFNQAKQLLENAPKMVCNTMGASEFDWNVKKDRSVAEVMRLRILEALAAIQ
ncbi:MAG: hypothetical protein PHV34_13295 [Verrucomicrobiae bacterium]|nr:hypothetical protein [Verrucomicrobiae bacterium]